MKTLNWMVCAAGLLVAGVTTEMRAAAPEAMTRMVRMLAETDDAQLQLDILRGLSAGFRGQERLPMPAGWEQVENRLGGSANGDVRTLVQTLSLTFGSQGALKALRALAADPKAEAGARRNALDSLMASRDPDLRALLQRLVPDAAVRGVVLRQLAAFDDGATPGLILAEYGKLAAGEKRDALNTLVSRVNFAKPLLAAVGAGTVPRTDLTAELVRQLRNLRNPDLEKQIAQVWGVMKDTSPDMAKEIERYKALYWKGGSTPGDASKGRVVYNQVCAQCHHLFDSGGAVGPDITGANRSDLEYLLQNILFPNAVIPNEYRQTLVETKDGRLISGIVKGQEGGTLLIQTANEVVRVAVADIATREQAENSMMPEGLVAGLEEQQVRDLLYYLGRPGQVPLPK
jgi:putative heme-binding domain-containing protein